MKKNLVRMGFMGLVLVWGGKMETVGMAAPPPEPGPAPKLLARFHYVGAAQLAGNTNGSQLRKIWALPETVRFREEVMKKLAKAPREFFPKHGTNESVDPSAWFRPLLDEVIQAESFGELRDEGRGNTSFALAFQLTDQHAKIWSTNLWQAASAWQGASPAGLTGVASAGWEAQSTNPSAVFRFLRAGPWVVITTGPAQSHSNLLAQIAREGRPIAAASNYWFDAEVDSAQLQRWLGSLPIRKFPAAHVTITGKGENLRTNLRLTFAEPIPWKHEPWQIPTNIIQDPGNSLTSFAAVRGVSSLLKDTSAIKMLEWASPPDQLYVWSYLQVPFRSYVAAAVPNASNVLNQLAPHLASLLGTNLVHPGNGEIGWSSNHTRLVWKGLPFIAPYAGSIKKPEGEFLLAGLFPSPPPTNAPLPAALLGGFSGSTNRCYYQWEITQERLYQWRAMYSLYYVIAGLRPASANLPGQQWLLTVSTNLGNSITEITATSPQELQLVRNSHLNLTGFELVHLTHWIESTSFPHQVFELFPVMQRPPVQRAAKPAAAPVAKPPGKPKSSDQPKP